MTGELFEGTADALSPAEKALESEIALAAMRLRTATTVEAKRRWFATLKALHARRTQHTVERMERKQGLR